MSGPQCMNDFDPVMLGRLRAQIKDGATGIIETLEKTGMCRSCCVYMIMHALVTIAKEDNAPVLGIAHLFADVLGDIYKAHMEVVPINTTRTAKKPTVH